MYFFIVKFYWSMEVFRKIINLMNANVLRRTWTWTRRMIFCLRQRRKTDNASDLRTVSEWSWLRQYLSTFQDKDWKWDHVLAWCLKGTKALAGHMLILYDAKYHTDGLVQERRNSSALAMELRLCCTNLSIYGPQWVNGIVTITLSLSSTNLSIYGPQWVNCIVTITLSWWHEAKEQSVLSV